MLFLKKSYGWIECNPQGDFFFGDSLDSGIGKLLVEIGSEWNLQPSGGTTSGEDEAPEIQLELQWSESLQVISGHPTEIQSKRLPPMITLLWTPTLHFGIQSHSEVSPMESLHFAHLGGWKSDGSSKKILNKNLILGASGRSANETFTS